MSVTAPSFGSIGIRGSHVPQECRKEQTVQETTSGTFFILDYLGFEYFWNASSLKIKYNENNLPT